MAIRRRLLAPFIDPPAATHAVRRQVDIKRPTVGVIRKAIRPTTFGMLSLGATKANETEVPRQKKGTSGQPLSSPPISRLNGTPRLLMAILRLSLSRGVLPPLRLPSVTISVTLLRAAP